MSTRAVLFDLDDTLYNELDFFRSGFSIVALELESRGVGSFVQVLDTLLEIHCREGREFVLQKAARRLDFPEHWIPGLVMLIRSHTPTICLYEDAVQALGDLRGAGYLLGCVTDGWSDVQWRKIQVLGVRELVDCIVVADDFGSTFWKPHPLPFLECCKRLDVAPLDAVFVGDNPERDIVGAYNAGISCIRIRRKGSYFAMMESQFPVQEITSLLEVKTVLSRVYHTT